MAYDARYSVLSYYDPLALLDYPYTVPPVFSDEDHVIFSYPADPLDGPLPLDGLQLTRVSKGFLEFELAGTALRAPLLALVLYGSAMHRNPRPELFLTLCKHQTANNGVQGAQG